MKMNKKQVIVSIAMGAMFMSGCVSVDGTRAQLSSKDASEVKKGEETIYTIATTGRDSSGFVQFQTPQMVEYVQLTSNQDLLLRIIDNAYNGEVIAAVTERLDFSKKGAAHSFIQERFGQLKRVDDKRKEDLKEQIISKLTQDELLDLLEVQKISDDRDKLLDRLIAITDSPMILWRMLEGDISIYRHQTDTVRGRLLSMLDKVTDEQTIEKILAARDLQGWDRYLVDKPEHRILLARKLPESKMVELVLADIKGHSLGAWNNDNLAALETGIGITAYVKDTKSSAKILASILAKIPEYRKECESSCTMDWDQSDKKKVKELIAGIPKLPDSVIAALVCYNESTWKYLIDRVTEESAYRILTQGKAKSDELEVALVKKLPASRVDMKVFANVKTYAGKKAVMAAMPAETRKAAQESTAKALAAVMDKAKEARKETFEMHGFYLGMDWEDMKLVLAHHFPDYEIREARDGDGKNADYIVYITKQSTPFCYASAKDKKIYQFNFGKLVLKKWYKYDVQTFMEWAHAYSRETGIDMKFKMLEEDTEVFEYDMSRSYRVWFHQESYQYKHNTKEYRLTYFGEEEDYTFHGGIGGALIKARAARDFRYVRDNPGTLRAKIERD